MMTAFVCLDAEMCSCIRKLAAPPDMVRLQKNKEEEKRRKEIRKGVVRFSCCFANG